MKPTIDECIAVIDDHQRMIGTLPYRLSDEILRILRSVKEARIGEHNCSVRGLERKCDGCER